MDGYRLQDRDESGKIRKKRFRIEMNGDTLKKYGCATMLFYTLSMSVIQQGFIGVANYSTAELTQAIASDPDLMILASWGVLFQLIGGLALPVFAFLLVEGFVHTSNYKRYLLSFLAFGLVSEVPFDLAMTGKLWSMEGQNVMFTYALCLIMLYGLRLLVGKKGLKYRIAQVMIILAALLWCNLLCLHFGTISVLLTAVYYLLYDRQGYKVLMGCAVSILYITAPLSGYAIFHYTGKRGNIRNKYIYYALYPLHLLILGVAAKLIAA